VGEKKHIMVFKVAKVSCDEEIDAHVLEVEYAKLKVKSAAGLILEPSTHLQLQHVANFFQSRRK
jgi:hypothetical protein